MNYTLIAYCIYLPVTLLLTVWVANKLLTNAKVFYVDIFQGQNEQAFSLNKLIQVGFYLIGLGFAFLFLQIHPEWVAGTNETAAHPHYIDTAQGLIETLSGKVGGFVVILGVMLFFNLILILTQRSSAARNAAQTLARAKAAEVKG